jgi:uncharacterized protein (TIGR03084 family)
MAVDLHTLCDDLWEEQRVLASRIEGLSDEQWRLDTPARGWTVGDAISHLHFFTEMALEAVTAPERFVAERTVVADESPRPDLAFTSVGPELCADWMELTSRLLEAVQSMEEPARVPWYGPDMSNASFVTARIMETWAHGQDIADALGLDPVVSPRLRHICHLGVITRGYSYGVHHLPTPTQPVTVRLQAPDRGRWTWNDQDEAGGCVEGPALDFALVVTRRRRLAETSLRAVGSDARTWMQIAQAFAGNPEPPASA